MSTFILVSGAWHGGWCWERIIPMLENEGHRVIAPDLLGTGSDLTSLDQVSLESWADQIAALVRQEPGPVVLAGHSRGGIVISEAAERIPERVRALVFIAAGLVLDGDSLLAASNRLMPNFGLDMVTMHPDGTYTANPEAVMSRLYNRTDPKWSERAQTRLRPDPTSALTTKIHLTQKRFGSIPRVYIETLEDRTVPIAMQRAMQKDMPCKPVFTLSSDHSPFYSDPDGLVHALLSIAQSTS